MDTLRSLVDALNDDLHPMVGNTGMSALEVCQNIRNGIILKGSFYHKLLDNNMQDFIAFREGIENLSFIYLKTTGDNQSQQRIIKINVVINLFNESDASNGGIIANVQAELVDMGLQMKDVPLSQIVSYLHLSSIRKKKTKAESELKEIEQRETILRKIIAECEEDEARFMQDSEGFPTNVV